MKHNNTGCDYSVTISEMRAAEKASKEAITKAIIRKDEKMFFSSAKDYYKAKKGGDLSMTTA